MPRQDCFDHPGLQAWLMEQQEAGRKACVTADDLVHGDYVAGKAAIEKKILRIKKKGISWQPQALPPKPSRPIFCWSSNQEKVRHNSREAVKHFLAPGQAVGQGEAVFWLKKVPIEKLTMTKVILGKKGVMVGKSSIAMKDLVAWEDLFQVSWSAGPSRDLCLTTLGWKAMQVAMYEICLALYDLDSGTHAWVNTSQEYVSPTPKKKIAQRKHAKKARQLEVEREEQLADVDNLNYEMEERNDNIVDFQQEAAAEAVVEQVIPVEPAEVEGNALTPVKRFEFRFRRRHQQEEEQVEGGVEVQEELGVQEEQGVQQGQVEQEEQEQDYHPLVPILQDWLQYGEGETLSSFSYQAKLQLKMVTISDTAILLELHDSCSTIQATLHESYREDVRFLGQHAILTLDTTTGGPRELVIVSSIGLQSFVLILLFLFFHSLFHIP